MTSIKSLPDEWTKDPKEVAKVESLPWTKIIRLLDKEEIKEKNITLDYSVDDRARQIITLIRLIDTYASWDMSTRLYDRFACSDEAYRIFQRNFPGIVVLLGCCNGH